MFQVLAAQAAFQCPARTLVYKRLQRAALRVASSGSPPARIQPVQAFIAARQKMIEAQILQPKRSDRRVGATIHHPSFVHVYHDRSLPTSPDNSFAAFASALLFFQASRYATKT